MFPYTYSVAVIAETSANLRPLILSHRPPETQQYEVYGDPDGSEWSGYLPPLHAHHCRGPPLPAQASRNGVRRGPDQWGTRTTTTTYQHQ